MNIILIINFDYGKNKKYLPREINFPEKIDLTSFTDEEWHARTYKLMTVGTHLGSTHHYIAYCKSYTTYKWYKFDDSNVNECRFEETKKNIIDFLIYCKDKVY